MKKLLSVLLCTVLLFTFCAFAVSAEDVTEHFDNYSTGMYIDGELTCIIRNEFYSIYADEYFEEQYDEFNSCYETWKNDYIEWVGEVRMTRSTDGTVKGVQSFVDAIRNGEGIWYCTVIFNYLSDFSSERNYEFASSLSEGMEVLYVGNSAPCAVVAVRGSTDDIDNIIENENVAFVETAFSSVNGRWFTCDIIEIQYQPKASDARKILRYSAGLEELPEARSLAKQFFVLSDTDLDGKITASDARNVLRISAGIEAGHLYFHSTGSAWYF